MRTNLNMVEIINPIISNNMSKANSKNGVDAPTKLEYETPQIQVIELDSLPTLLSGSTQPTGGKFKDVERGNW